MQYFTVAELTASATATSRGIDNTPSPVIRENLIALVDNVLDPIRKAWGSCINVSSGYRCPLLNASVGGAASSYHMRGLAADLIPARGTPRQLFDFIIKMRDLPFDKVILEHTRSGTYWVHITFDPKRPIVVSDNTSLSARRIIVRDLLKN